MMSVLALACTVSLVHQFVKRLVEVVPIFVVVELNIYAVTVSWLLVVIFALGE